MIISIQPEQRVLLVIKPNGKKRGRSAISEKLNTFSHSSWNDITTREKVQSTIIDI